MKKVYFIRHAKSSWENATLADIDRPLNKRGFRDAPFMAKLLLSKEGPLERLFSSPARRAFTTATFFAEAQGLLSADIVVEDRIYHADEEDMLDLIRELPDELSTVAFFGHNPTFTFTVNRFAEDYISNMPTCSIALIHSVTDSWENFETTGRLAAFYYPKQYFT